MSDKYMSHLLQPGKIGGLELSNRIVLPPMITEYADEDGCVTQRQAAYYAERARGGCGLVVVEASCVQSPTGRGFSRQICLDDDKYIPGLRQLAMGIRENGAKAAIQLFHAGCGAPEFIVGGPAAGPSLVSLPTGESCRALTAGEMDEIKECFVKASVRCERGGFDAVVLHACHGYLLANFLSPVWNRRSDGFGGSAENRARYPAEVLRAVKAAVDIPVLVRINLVEYGGREVLGAEEEHTLEDAVTAARILEANGADGLETSCWGFGSLISKGLLSDVTGETLPMVATVKKAVGIPVIGHGHVTFDMADAAIAEGRADFWGFGRSQIADPYLACKLKEGRATQITPCILCNRCEPVSQFGKETDGLRCSANSRAGREAGF